MLRHPFEGEGLLKECEAREGEGGVRKVVGEDMGRIEKRGGRERERGGGGEREGGGGGGGRERERERSYSYIEWEWK